MANVPGKEMIRNKRGLKVSEMIKPLVTFFKICCFMLEPLGSKKGTVSERFGTFFGLKHQKMI